MDLTAEHLYMTKKKIWCLFQAAGFWMGCFSESTKHDCNIYLPSISCDWCLNEHSDHSAIQVDWHDVCISGIGFRSSIYWTVFFFFLLVCQEARNEWDCKSWRCREPRRLKRACFNISREWLAKSLVCCRQLRFPLPPLQSPHREVARCQSFHQLLWKVAVSSGVSGGSCYRKFVRNCTMSVFRASWLAKCASRFAFRSDCRSQRERQPALLPSRRVTRNMNSARMRVLAPMFTHLFLVV